jgi:hypothetical protein
MDRSYYGLGIDASLFSTNVRDHRWLPVARIVPVERSGTSTERDTDSHSVHRSVSIIFILLSGVDQEHHLINSAAAF